MERYDVSKDVCEIISSGSHGNAVLYHRSILVDLGVPYKWVKYIQNEVQLLLLTHVHTDHFNASAIRNLCFERPTLRIGCGEFMLPYLDGIKNVDVMESGKVYDYGTFKISPITLYHDVKCFGYRIFKGDHKTIHITDTAHLEGITAKNYDLYAIESNYDCENMEERIKQKEMKGEFAYQRNSINSHLSHQQSKDFIFANKKESSKVVRLHESKNN
jgi:phosphoribosyl 1,2-cyclic phosphodiesterase